METSGYTTQIRDGLFDPSPRDSIFRVKAAVADELAALDDTARIRSTDFFNHTFAPDFVLTWPDKAERHVFLRMSYDLNALVEDVALIDSHDPFIFGLTPNEGTEKDSRIDGAVEESGAMFAEPDALERLIDRKKTDSTANMLSNAIAQGGRGTFIGNEAVEFASVVSRGFEAASDVKAAGTAEAISEIEERLGGPQAWRMNRVLQAVWEGSEGPLMLFPGKADLSGRLNIESLRYLVTYMRTDDPEFWKRVGRGLKMADLEHLDFAASRPNIERLIKANLDILSARAMVLVDDPLGVGEIDRESKFSWDIRERRLTFEAPGFFAFIGATKKDLESVRKTTANPVAVSTFVDRAEKAELAEVTLHSGSEVFILKHEDGAIDTHRLVGVSGQFDGPSEVTQAIATSSSGRVTVDLTAMSGTGQTRSKIRLADLLVTATPLLRDLPYEDTEALNHYLAYEVDHGGVTLDVPDDEESLVDDGVAGGAEPDDEDE
ncbi:hypothetical protein [Agromyces cerinus]|uniref:Uncharacterized protein n=1 Tax=Agromyces cerinus subsp. cerinus TaxID=232089 RepID=A0A1N6I4Z9_9MICO|nr:hypothetical protein [Agromyces cerinus]SIO27073.1 hypothetical protein SAMN05443544_3682 [Agromyces cerinus subsp. cerinus]